MAHPPKLCNPNQNDTTSKNIIFEQNSITAPPHDPRVKINFSVFKKLFYHFNSWSLNCDCFVVGRRTTRRTRTKEMTRRTFWPCGKVLEHPRFISHTCFLECGSYGSLIRMGIRSLGIFWWYSIKIAKQPFKNSIRRTVLRGMLRVPPYRAPLLVKKDSLNKNIR